MIMGKQAVVTTWDHLMRKNEGCVCFGTRRKWVEAWRKANLIEV